MAFSLKFYNVSDPPNKLDKTLGTQIASCATVRPYEAVSELFGNFLIDYNPTINGCNYCYCPELGKYYYITDIQMETGSRMIVSVKVDALMTYKSKILEAKIYAQRTSKQGEEATLTGYNSMLPDSTIQLSTQKTYILKPFRVGELGNAMQFVYPTNEYFLAVIG